MPFHLPETSAVELLTAFLETGRGILTPRPSKKRTPRAAQTAKQKSALESELESKTAKMPLSPSLPQQWSFLHLRNRNYRPRKASND